MHGLVGGPIPDFKYNIVSITTNDTEVCFFATFTGTHTGAGGPVEASDPPKQVKGTYVYLVAFNDEGKVMQMTKCVHILLLSCEALISTLQVLRYLHSLHRCRLASAEVKRRGDPAGTSTRRVGAFLIQTRPFRDQSALSFSRFFFEFAFFDFCCLSFLSFL